MKKLILIFALAVSFCLSAQNITLAKLAFEEAEEAYNNNNYELALEKLSEAEHNFGTINPPILHLRIVSQHKVFEDQPSLELANSIKENCDIWFKNYSENQDLFDKTRDIYKINNTIKAAANNEEQLSTFITKKEENEAKNKALQMAKEIENLYNRIGIVKIATGSGAKSANIDLEITIHLDFKNRVYELTHKMIPRNENTVDFYGSEEKISLNNIKEINVSKQTITFKYHPKGSQNLITYGNKPPDGFEAKLSELISYLETIN